MSSNKDLRRVRAFEWRRGSPETCGPKALRYRSGTVHAHSTKGGAIERLRLATTWPCAGQSRPSSTSRLIVRRSPGGHQTPILTNRADLSAAQVAYRMAARWREENYSKYAREHFALDALDSHADQRDDQYGRSELRLIPGHPAPPAAAVRSTPAFP